MRQNVREWQNIPVIGIASSAKPLYLPTPFSSDMPVPLEMSIAAIYHRQLAARVYIHSKPALDGSLKSEGRRTRGVHPPLATFRTHSSCSTLRVNQAAAHDMRMTAIRGMGESMTLTKAAPRRARMKRVRRSPRHAASGGVILSVTLASHTQPRC